MTSSDGKKSGAPHGWSASFESDASAPNSRLSESLMPSRLRSRGQVTDAFVWKIWNAGQLHTGTTSIVGPKFRIGEHQMKTTFTKSGETLWVSFEYVKPDLLLPSDTKDTKTDEKTAETATASASGDISAMTVSANEFDSEIGMNNPFKTRTSEHAGICSDELFIEYTYEGGTQKYVRILAEKVPGVFYSAKTPSLPVLYFSGDELLRKKADNLIIRLFVITLSDTMGSDFDDSGTRQLTDDIERQLLRLNKNPSTSAIPVDAVRLVAGLEEESASKKDAGASPSKTKCTFLVSRFLLSARSPMFRRMFEAASFAAASDVSVPADAKTLTAFVGYLHSGHVSSALVWTAAEALALFELAEYYEMSDLANTTVGKIDESLRPDAALPAMRAALRHAHFVEDEDEQADLVDTHAKEVSEEQKAKSVSKFDSLQKDLLLSAARLLVRMAETISASESKGVSAISISASSSDGKTTVTPPSTQDSTLSGGAAAGRLITPWNGRDGCGGGLLARAAIRYASRNFPAVIESLMSDS